MKVSKLHYLIPSSFVNDAVCAGVVSALVNRYPIPTIIGYKGENEYDAANHLAKLRVIDRFLGNSTSEDDDLVIIVDSLDVLAQLPAEVMIERYFDISLKSEQRLADQRGITLDQLHELGIRQSILYGAGKMCFIGSPHEPLCPLMPASNSARYKFGVKTGVKDVRFLDPRYLNSGTIIGPAGDLRRFISAVLQLVDADDAVIDADDKEGNTIHHMDQWFTATLYVRQEYHRALDLNNGQYPGDLSNLTALPKPRQGVNDTTEYHVFVDFESQFTQTQCRNQLEIHQLKYSNHDLTTTITKDFLKEGKVFRPRDIQMPSNLYQAFGSVWDNISNITDLPLVRTQREWIQGLSLATNVASENIYAFYHNTCEKTWFLDRYRDLWFYPLIVPLLQISRRELQEAKTLHPGIVDGRVWMAAESYPISESGSEADQDELGGVFTDLQAQPFIHLRTLCRENWTDIIGTRPIKLEDFYKNLKKA